MPTVRLSPSVKDEECATLQARWQQRCGRSTGVYVGCQEVLLHGLRLPSGALGERTNKTLETDRFKVNGISDKLGLIMLLMQYRVRSRQCGVGTDSSLVHRILVLDR